MGRVNKYYTNVVPNMNQIKRWCRDGDAESVMCKRMGIAVSTFEKYKLEQPDLVKALKNGKEEMNFKVENMLLKKCMGHTVKKVTTTINSDGLKIDTETIKEIPPDVVAIKYWLANKSKDKWREKREVDMNLIETPIFSGEDEL